MRVFFKTFFITFSVFSLLCCEQEETPKFVIVLVDETGSFGIYRDGNPTMFWNEIIPLAASVIDRLEGGDRFAVVGIDDHGFDSDDVRIPEQTIDPRALIAFQQKSRIKRGIRELQPRQHRRPYTDILGALYHTAYFLGRESGYRNVVIIFSDMIQTPRYPTPNEARELKFPPETEIYCFYVNASEMDEITGRVRPGIEEWRRLLDVWIPILRNAGVNVDERNFNQRGVDVNRELDRILGYVRR